MERLTHYGPDGRPYSTRGYEVTLARLAAYEDIGLEPEKIKAKLQHGYSPADQTPPDRFLAQTKWGKVVLVERRDWGDPDWLVGGMYIPKDIVWWWPLPEPVGGAE